MRILSIKYYRISFCYVLLAFAGNKTHAQENLELHRGNKAFTNGQYDAAKTHYQKALEANPNSYKGTYNLGNTNYREEHFEDALSHYQQAVAAIENNPEAAKQRAQALHNLGNTYLKSGKLDESIKAYKDALRLDPSADDTRYNLAYAQRMKKQQEQQQEQNKDEKNKEEKEDKQEQNKEGENKDEKQEQKKDDKQKEEGQNEKQGQPEQKPMNLSPREAEQLLEAAKNEDQKIQMMMLRQQKAKTKQIEKDW